MTLSQGEHRSQFCWDLARLRDICFEKKFCSKARWCTLFYKLIKKISCFNSFTASTQNSPSSMETTNALKTTTTGTTVPVSFPTSKARTTTMHTPTFTAVPCKDRNIPSYVSSPESKALVEITPEVKAQFAVGTHVVYIQSCVIRITVINNGKWDLTM